MVNAVGKKKTIGMVTLKDIAERTGYSVNTVSHALRGKPDISEKTKKLVEQTAREMGYIGNALASSMRSGFSKTIAVIIGDISNPLFGIMAKEMEITLGELGYSMFVMNTNEDAETERKAILSALNKSVDGLILCPTQKSAETLELLESIRIPYVLLGRRPDEDQARPNYIVWDDYQGGLLATGHLLSLGHERILCLSGPSYISSARDRLEGYHAAHRQYGVPVEESLVRKLPLIGHDLDRAVRDAAQGGGFTGVFAFSDMIAWETIHTLKAMRKRVPEDVSVVGFDDIQSQMAFPCELTTIHTPKTMMAVRLVEALMKKINQKTTKIIQTVLPVELVVRETTRPAEDGTKA